MKVRLHGTYDLFGLIYDVTIHDDLVMRQLILADALEPELVLDQRENRLTPIELSVLPVGYKLNGRIVQGLPPQPPANLDSLVVCDDVELQTFTANLTHLRLIFKAAQIPADELVVVHLRQAIAARPPELRHRFLVEAGQELVRLLGYDLVRLESILRRLIP